MRQQGRSLYDTIFYGTISLLSPCPARRELFGQFLPTQERTVVFCSNVPAQVRSGDDLSLRLSVPQPCEAVAGVLDLNIGQHEEDD